MFSVFISIFILLKYGKLQSIHSLYESFNVFHVCYQVVQQDHYKRCVKQLKRKSRDYYSFRIVITIIFFPLYLFLFFLKWSNRFTKNCHYCTVRKLPITSFVYYKIADYFLCLLKLRSSSRSQRRI